jgi:hypothetical protein
MSTSAGIANPVVVAHIDYSVGFQDLIYCDWKCFVKSRLTVGKRKQPFEAMCFEGLNP